jgi:hypothetical protein
MESLIVNFSSALTIAISKLQPAKMLEAIL